MKATLYDVLGVSPGASQIEIKTALRGLVRKYYQESTTEGRDAEEILRFLNHAASTLSDPEKRAKYDAELKRIDLTREDEAGGEGFSPSDSVPKVAVASLEQSLQKVRKVPKAGSLSGSRLRQGLLVGFALVVITFLSFRTPTSGTGIEHFTFLATWLGIGLVVIGIVYGAVWVVSRLVRKSAQASIVTDSMIMLGGNTSVFLGGPQLSEKSAGTFRFHLGKTSEAEQRSSVERPWLRFTARMIDYGVWGLLCGYILGIAASLGAVSESTRNLLVNPLIAPALIVLLWVPVETACLFFLRTTPGRWLTNTQLNFNVSDPFAPDTPGYRLTAIFRRSVKVWSRGMGLGLPVITLVAQSVSKQYLATHHETAWDLDGDCLVTHGKVGLINSTAMLTVFFLLVSIYGHVWEAPVHAGLGWVQSSFNRISSPVVVEKPVDIVQAEPAATIETKQKTARTNFAALNEQAKSLSRDQNWEGLIAHCKRWSNQDAKNADAWHCLGNGYYKLKQYKSAITALEKAGKLAPEDTTIKNDLGNTFRAQYQQ